MIYTVTHFAHSQDPLSAPGRVSPRPARRPARVERTVQGR